MAEITRTRRVVRWEGDDEAVDIGVSRKSKASVEVGIDGVEEVGELMGWEKEKGLACRTAKCGRCLDVVPSRICQYGLSEDFRKSERVRKASLKQNGERKAEGQAVQRTD